MSLFEQVGLPSPSPSFDWTEEQKIALDAIDEWFRGGEQFFSLTGPAGTGKTTLVREVVARYSHAVLTAMTGKAALRLSQLAGRDATTLHSKLYWPPKPGEDLRFVRLREPPSGFVICDESSMITPPVFNDLQRWGVRLLFVGDSYQLPPVITGEDLKKYGEDYSVFAHVAGISLKTVMRSSGGVLRAATQVRDTGKICLVSDMAESGDGYEFVQSKTPIERAVNDYVTDREDHLLITWKNANRMKASRMIRERLGYKESDGPLPEEGEPVLIKKNGQGFLNGEIVECGGFEPGPIIGSLQTYYMKIGKSGMQLLVSVDGGSPEKGGEFFDGSVPWIVNWRKYHIDLQKLALPEPTPITWGYCLTAHSSQGSEARRVTVFLCRGDDRSVNFTKPTTLPSGESVPFSARFLYTATTRGKKRATMITGR